MPLPAALKNWISDCKAYAAKHNCSYKQAMSALKKLKKSRKSYNGGGHNDLAGSPLNEGFTGQEGNTEMKPAAGGNSLPTDGGMSGGLPDTGAKLPTPPPAQGGGGAGIFEAGAIKQTGGRRRRRRGPKSNKRSRNNNHNQNQNQNQNQNGGKRRKSRRGTGRRRRSSRGGSLSYSQY